MDMTNNYKEISWLFPSAEIVVDRCHYVRQVYFALDAVRKRIQKQFPDNKRLHFKRNNIRFMEEVFRTKRRRSNRFKTYVKPKRRTVLGLEP